MTTHVNHTNSAVLIIYAGPAMVCEVAQQIGAIQRPVPLILPMTHHSESCAMLKCAIGTMSANPAQSAPLIALSKMIWILSLIHSDAKFNGGSIRVRFYKKKIYTNFYTKLVAKCWEFKVPEEAIYYSAAFRLHPVRYDYIKPKISERKMVLRSDTTKKVINRKLEYKWKRCTIQTGLKLHLRCYLGES